MTPKEKPDDRENADGGNTSQRVPAILDNDEMEEQDIDEDIKRPATIATINADFDNNGQNDDDDLESNHSQNWTDYKRNKKGKSGSAPADLAHCNVGFSFLRLLIEFEWRRVLTQFFF